MWQDRRGFCRRVRRTLQSLTSAYAERSRLLIERQGLPWRGARAAPVSSWSANAGLPNQPSAIDAWGEECLEIGNNFPRGEPGAVTWPRSGNDWPTNMKMLPRRSPHRARHRLLSPGGSERHRRARVRRLASKGRGSNSRPRPFLLQESSAAVVTTEKDSARQD